MMNAIIWATCTVFEITEETLLTNKSTDVSQIRYCIYYLLCKHIEIREAPIVHRMQIRNRSIIHYGVSKIDVHKKIYRQTIDTLRKIIDTANTFDKKHTWLIPSINTTH